MTRDEIMFPFCSAMSKFFAAVTHLETGGDIIATFLVVFNHWCVKFRLLIPDSVVYFMNLF